MGLKIKICGITSPDDAQAAVKAGADALGFMFYHPSPRNVSLSAVAGIVRELPPFVARVGVFVDATAEFVEQAIGECRLDTLQFHGQETPEFCARFDLATIKAFRVRDTQSLAEIERYRTSAWLLDSYVPEKLGGSGATFNWSLAAAAKKFGRPIILAGGLTAENVAAAVRQVRPYGVDVSSGVEGLPGQKEPAKVRAFIAAARAAAAG